MNINTELPIVSIVCVTHLESNKHYLEACLKSIDNLGYPKDKLDVVLISSGDFFPDFFLKAPWINHHHYQSRLHFPEAVNEGVKKTNPLSKHLLIINDDVILTRFSLANMVQAVGHTKAIIGPISNCDNYVKYNLIFMLNGNHFTNRFYRLEENSSPDLIKSMMNQNSHYPGGVIYQGQMFFYCILIPRDVWNIVGPLDPNFKTGQDDIDYSKRCAQKRIPMVVALNALVWHAGGATADKCLTPEIRQENIKYFTQKWSEAPPL